MLLVPSDRVVRGTDLRVYRTPLEPVDLATVKRIPSVTATRALFDARLQGATDRQLRVGFDDARRTGQLRVDRALRRAQELRRHPGATRFRHLFAQGVLDCESEGERALAPLLRGMSPPPVWGAWVCGRRYRLDAFWPIARVAAEYDGRQRHTFGTDLEHDASRRLDLLAAGILPVQVTWSMVRDHPQELVRHLQAIVDDRSAHEG